MFGLLITLLKVGFFLSAKNEFVNKLSFPVVVFIPHLYQKMHQNKSDGSLMDFNVGLQKIPGYEISRTGFHEMDGKISPG